jgi:hypothetical protein
MPWRFSWVEEGGSRRSRSLCEGQYCRYPSQDAVRPVDPQRSVKGIGHFEYVVERTLWCLGEHAR